MYNIILNNKCYNVEYSSVYHKTECNNGKSISMDYKGGKHFIMVLCDMIFNYTLNKHKTFVSHKCSYIFCKMHLKPYEYNDYYTLDKSLNNIKNILCINLIISRDIKHSYWEYNHYRATLLINDMKDETEREKYLIENEEELQFQNFLLGMETDRIIKSKNLFLKN